GEHGGGAAILEADARIDRCLFDANDAPTGGGLMLWTGTTATIVSTDIVGNTADVGAGVAIEDGFVDFVSVVINGNWAEFVGGGVSAEGSLCTITNVVMSANTAGLIGGGIAGEASELTATNVTMSANTTDLFGGGVYVFGVSEATLRNCILWQNHTPGESTEESQIDGDELSVIDVAHTLIDGLTGGLGGVGNIAANPLFRDPAGGDDTPGTLDDDLRLAVGSPATDAGDNASLPPDVADLDEDSDVAEPTPNDADAQPRRFDDPDVPDTGSGVAPLVDMGAFEFSGVPVTFVGAPGESWFEPASWSEGMVPTAVTDVIVTGEVVIDAPGGVARSVTVRSGGMLRITTGTLSTPEIEIDAGGTIELDDPVAELSVTHLEIAAGAVLQWNAGRIALAAGGLWSQPDGLAFGCIGSAELEMGVGSTMLTPTVEVCAMGSLIGGGTIDGDLTNDGAVTPGPGLATLTLRGNYTQGAGGALAIEVRRLSVAFEHDRLVVSAAVQLDGVLHVELAPGFQAELGEVDAVILGDPVIGSFGFATYPNLFGQLLFDTIYADDTVSLIMLPPTPRLYVDDDAAPSGFGTTWTNPLNDLQEALAAAEALGDLVTEIWVAEGTYVPSQQTDPEQPRSATFRLVDGVRLVGGFAGNETDASQRDIAAHPTVLSGDLNGDDGPAFTNIDDNSYHVVFADTLAQPAILDGLVFTPGHAETTFSVPSNRGGGLYLEDVTATVRDCTFVENSSYDPGAGVSVEDGDYTIIECLFTGNTSGGGMSALRGFTSVTGCTFELNDGNGPCCGTFRAGGLVLAGDAVVTDCHFAHNDASSGGGMSVGAASTVLIDDCTFTNNTANHGGALRTSTTNLAVVHSDFIDNTATSGGGAVTVDSSLPVMFESCTFSGNSTESLGGGAIYAGDTELMLTACTFTANTGAGAALYLGGSPTTMTGCTFIGNDAPNDLGAIWSSHAACQIIDCLFQDNTGCAARIDESDGAVIDRCRFVGNSANGHFGGGLRLFRSETLVTNSLFTGNFAPEEGGGIHTYGNGPVTVRQCTMHGNVAGEIGGGLRHADIQDGLIASLTVSDSIFWDNVADGVIDEDAQVSVHPDVLSTIDYCCIRDLGTISGTGNIGDDPVLVDPYGPDGTAGTGDEDLHPSATSPCVNAGDLLYAGPPDELDLDGLARLQVCRLDIGAYETDGPDPQMPDCNDNDVFDECDIADGTSLDCNLNGIPDECDVATGDCDGNGIPDECDLSVGGAGLDCDGNGVIDACDIASGAVEDCNANGVPDACDIATSHAAASDELSPMGFGFEQEYHARYAPEASGPVTLSFAAFGDLSSSSEHIAIRVDGTLVGTVFTSGASDCDDVNGELVLTAESYNAARTGPDALIAMEPTTSVQPGYCTQHSYISVSIAYAIDPTSLDTDGDGIPDECACGNLDLDGNGDVGFSDILQLIGMWGPCSTCPEDLNGNGTVDFGDVLLVIAGWGPCPGSSS
ncbi:MAG: right-handed parallel beta-helix repeat-containing protein, partial [Planctomycetes bacterium]|nr:right-handed parallel beta-helix repeat-containing protein [Planctomycetota bacterium]